MQWTTAGKIVGTFRKVSAAGSSTNKWQTQTYCIHLQECFLYTATRIWFFKGYLLVSEKRFLLEMISQIPRARPHLDRGKTSQTPQERSSQDCAFCWRKGGVCDKQSRLCWKETNMFVVPLVHIFPNIVLDLENSGCPCPGRKTQNSVLLQAEACAQCEPPSCHKSSLRRMVPNGLAEGGSSSRVLDGRGAVHAHITAQVE